MLKEWCRWVRNAWWRWCGIRPALLLRPDHVIQLRQPNYVVEASINNNTFSVFIDSGSEAAVLPWSIAEMMGLLGPGCRYGKFCYGGIAG